MIRSLPLVSQLVDGHARRVSYVRISLTDRCNYRCQYCMPEAGVELMAREQILSFEEIERLVTIFIQLGVKRVRLTGGEPTVRKGVVDLVAQLGRLGLDDLAMTTNGDSLAELAEPLKRAGLSRLNVSLDSLDRDVFQQIARRDGLARVLRGLDAAAEAGFTDTKINTVVMGGKNEAEIARLCRYAWQRGFVPRLIEFMPMSGGQLFSSGYFFSAAEMRAHIVAEIGPLAPAEVATRGVGPARYWQVADGEWKGKQVGVISAVTEPFCETCNRVRLSASGGLHTCLADDRNVDVRAALRSGMDDRAIMALVQTALAHKPVSHEFTTCGGGAPRKHMVAIGG